jgi:hypothetical protein
MISAPTQELVIMSEPKWENSPHCLPKKLSKIILPWGRCKPHHVPVYAECPIDDTSKMKERK